MMGITLIETPPPTYTVIVGPIKDAGENLIMDAWVTFVYGWRTYTVETNELGTTTTFTNVPISVIPYGTEITANQSDIEFKWK